MGVFGTLPTFEQSITQSGKTASVWYRFFSGLFNGLPSGAETGITLGASPYSYTAPSGGWIVVRGGTVSAIQYTRSVTTLTGLTAGIFPVGQGDVLIITYTVLPTVTFFPS